MVRYQKTLHSLRITLFLLKNQDKITLQLFVCKILILIKNLKYRMFCNQINLPFQRNISKIKNRCITKKIVFMLRSVYIPYVYKSITKTRP